MTAINTNVQAIVASNALAVNERSMSTSMERLSTGVRINSAKDDAAGLVISSKMTSQIRGLDQAVRNSNDAISLVQTAEGALLETTNMLQRMRELAVQSATDTSVSADRIAGNQEFQQLKVEINRIGGNTQWNGTNILDKSFSSGSGTFKFQVGANAAQTIDLSIGNFRANSAGGGIAVSTTTGASAAVDQVSTITISGTYAVGDVISVNVGDRSAQHTVAAIAVAGGGDPDTHELIAAAVFDQLGATFAPGVTTSYAANGTVITFTGDVVNTPFEISANTGGLLGNITNSVITDQATSNAAISAIDVAIAAVNTGRGEMGAVINRLQYASDNLANISANATESRSRILDTDYAKETTNMARSQIIAQAGTAMLAQANQVKQIVLSLLK